MHPDEILASPLIRACSRHATTRPGILSRTGWLVNALAAQPNMTTSADIRERMTHVLQPDLIGPEPGKPQASEVLAVPPSRWYLTGFLVPWSAPDNQREGNDSQGEFEMGEPSAPGDKDDTAPEPQAARRGQLHVVA